VVGNYAYVARSSGGLAIYDVSNFRECVQVGFLSIGRYTWSVAVQGRYAYLGDYEKGLYVIDVSNPAAPFEVCSYAGGFSKLAVAANYVYVPDRPTGVRVLDVSNPVNCVLAGRLATPRYIESLALSGNHLYLLERGDGEGHLEFHVFALSNPTNGTRVGGCELTGDGYDLALVETRAYIAAAYGGLHVIDVGVPSHCLRLGGYREHFFAQGVTVSGRYVYIAAPEGLVIIDASDPANCLRAGEYAAGGSAKNVAAIGNVAFVANRETGLQLIDVTNPARCERLGGSADNGVAMSVTIAGHHAYVADGPLGLEVIDVTTPANSRRVGGLFTGGQAWDVAVSGSFAYLADGPLGLQVIDVHSPSNCARVGGYVASGREYMGVTVAGNYAYAANDVGEIDMIDVHEPTNCTAVASFPGVSSAAAGAFVYVAAFESLQVMNVSDPSNIVRVGGLAITGSFGRDVLVRGKFAYVATDREPAVQIVDVSDPTNCVPVNSLSTGAGSYGLSASGNHLYVTTADGLQVFDISDPSHGRQVSQLLRSGGSPTGVAAEGARICVTDTTTGLLVLPSLLNVQFTLCIDGSPGQSFTVEAANDLRSPTWMPLLTTNVPAVPFEFVDFDVYSPSPSGKFYRVRQP
jgi:hypothetical protein